MGVYINPQGQTKENFLMQHGRRVTSLELDFNTRPADALPCVWVDNGSFTAIIVLYTLREFEYIVNYKDPRPKKYYYVSLDAIYNNSNLTNYMPRELLQKKND